MVLTDHRGVVDAEVYQVPAQHLFVYSWLMGNGSSVARVLDGVVTITLANATLTYEVVTDEAESLPLMVEMADYKGNLRSAPEKTANRVAQALTAQGLVARFVKGILTNPPPIDEDAAMALQQAREAREAAEALAAAQALLTSSKEG
jgi:hypothetical protein